MFSTPSDEREYKTFVTQRDGNFASFFTNASLISVAPIRTLPALSCLSVKLIQPDANGFATSDEFDRLSDIDQNVEQVAGDTAVFAGRQMGGGVNAYYFYATSDGILEKPFKTAMADLPEYEYDTRHQADPNWTTFFDRLLPTRIEQIIERSTIVRTLLAEEGDDGTAPRIIDHFVYFQSKEAVSAFEEKTRPMGFEITTTSTGIFRKTYRMVLSREGIPIEVDQVIIELDDLAQQFEGMHDGWEAFIVRV